MRGQGGCTQFFTCDCEIGPANRVDADTVAGFGICDGPHCVTTRNGARCPSGRNPASASAHI
jgi:hypothetical protein